LVLVGMMGSGKTTVGEVCAAQLHRPFFDTDALVEAMAGSTVADIFRDEGEAGFRARERAAVADALASPTPLVIACGGGAVVDGENRAALRRAGFVVWLDAPAEVLAARVGDDTTRPLLAGGIPVTTLTRLAHLRADAYRAAAHAVVDATGDAASVTAAVLEAFAAAA
jgi:shikimate kinase